MYYLPNVKDIPQLNRDHLSPRIKKVSSNDKIRIKTGFCRAKNLKDLLVLSAFPDLNILHTLNSDAIDCCQCNRKACDACHNFYTHQKGSEVWFQEKDAKSDNRYLTAQITSFIAPRVCSVTNSVLGRSVNFRLDFPITAVILSKKEDVLSGDPFH